MEFSSVSSSLFIYFFCTTYSKLCHEWWFHMLVCNIITMLAGKMVSFLLIMCLNDIQDYKGQPYITYIMGGLEGNRNLALHATARWGGTSLVIRLREHWPKKYCDGDDLGEVDIYFWSRWGEDQGRKWQQ